MSTRSQRKGRAAELELARLLQGHGYDVRPGEPVSYGREPDLVGLPGVHIECKRAEQLRLSEWIEQAQRDADRFQDGAPAVFHRRNRSPWLVTMRLNDWIRLYDRQEDAETDENKKGDYDHVFHEVQGQKVDDHRG